MNPIVIALLLFLLPAVAFPLPAAPVPPPEQKVKVMICDHFQAIHQPEKGRIVILCWEPAATPPPAGLHLN